jgi:hypoxanthine phosphoribosyltransferase
MVAAMEAASAHGEREVLTWPDFGRGCRELAGSVATDAYRPDIILAIARGGLFVAGSLGYALSVKNIYVMNVEYYTGVNERLPLPVALPPTPELVDIEDARVLIVDDVADTGNTLAYVHGFCGGKVAEVRSAVLYQKPTSVISCEYVWRRTDRWIDFPWSSLPPVVEEAPSTRASGTGVA